MDIKGLFESRFDESEKKRAREEAVRAAIGAARTLVFRADSGQTIEASDYRHVADLLNEASVKSVP